MANDVGSSTQEENVHLRIPASVIAEVRDFGWHHYLNTAEAVAVLLRYALARADEVATGYGDRRQSAEEVMVDSRM